MALLEPDEVNRRLEELPDWSLEGKTITRSFECGDFDGSVALVNRIAPIADGMNHHPDISISWATVTVSLSTHSEGGLTDADFELAAALDGLAASA